MFENLYRIYDLVSESYPGPIFIERKDEAAIRPFLGVLKNTDTTIGQHPEDFELRCLGTIDTHGVITSNIRTVTSGKQWKAMEEAKNG